MWKRLWKTWTIDKPAAFADLLWEVCVVQFAAWLDRVTVRQAIALIPAAILIVAYLHHVPMHPGVMLLGDFLAYMDIFSALFLLSILARVTTILFVLKQVSARTLELVRNVLSHARRLDIRHRRQRGMKARRGRTQHSKDNDEEGIWAGGLAWA